MFLLFLAPWVSPSLDPSLLGLPSRLTGTPFLIKPLCLHMRMCPLCGCLPIYKVAQGPQEMQRIKLLRLWDFFAIVQFTFASVVQVVLLKALCSCSSAG